MKGAIRSPRTVIYFLFTIPVRSNRKYITFDSTPNSIQRCRRRRLIVTISSMSLSTTILIFNDYYGVRVMGTSSCSFRFRVSFLARRVHNNIMLRAHFRVIRTSRYEISGGEITNNISYNHGTGNPRLKFINAKFGSTSVILLFNSAAVLITYIYILYPSFDVILCI